MQTYTVYRVEYRNRKTVRVGKVEERRKKERNNNASDIMRLAQRIYATSPLDSHIFVIRESSRLNLLFEDPKAYSATAGGG
jgi:hypothetical protein